MSFLLIGNRIPREYFITRGVGESDITVHAGSYHLALKDAGIECANIMTYSSIMPAIAKEISRPSITHGEVMESIVSCGTVGKGERLSGGIIYGWLYDKETGERFGGLVCERQEDMTQKQLRTELIASMGELYDNGFSEKYHLKDMNFIEQTVTPKKKYGTAMAAICFTNFYVPILNTNI